MNISFIYLSFSKVFRIMYNISSFAYRSGFTICMFTQEMFPQPWKTNYFVISNCSKFFLLYEKHRKRLGNLWYKFVFILVNTNYSRSIRTDFTRVWNKLDEFQGVVYIAFEWTNLPRRVLQTAHYYGSINLAWTIPDPGRIPDGSKKENFPKFFTYPVPSRSPSSTKDTETEKEREYTWYDTRWGTTALVTVQLQVAAASGLPVVRVPIFSRRTFCAPPFDPPRCGRA